MSLDERDRLIATYTTLGLGVVGLDWRTARRIAVEIVDEKLVVAGAGVSCGGGCSPATASIGAPTRPA